MFLFKEGINESHEHLSIIFSNVSIKNAGL